MDHRRHIEEIEAKIGGGTGRNLKVTSSRTIETIGRIQSPGEADFEQFEEEQLELEVMKKQLKDNFIKKENYLDAICDDLTKQSPLKKSDVASTKKVAAAAAPKKNIDPQKKTKLLAALKAIDGGNGDSFEK